MKTLKNKKGFSLIAALTILTLISLVGINLLTIQNNLLTATEETIDNTQAEYIAFTGIQRALYKIETQGSLIKNYASYNNGATIYYAYPHNNIMPPFKREDAIGLYNSTVPGIFRFDDNQSEQRIAVDLKNNIKIKYIGARFNNESNSNYKIGNYFKVYTEDDVNIPINGDNIADSIPNIPPDPQKKWGQVNDPKLSTIFFECPSNITYTHYILFVFAGNSTIYGTNVVELFAYKNINNFPQTYEYSPEKYKSDNIKGVYTYNIEKNNIICTGRLLTAVGSTYKTIGIHSIKGELFIKNYSVIMNRYMDIWDHIPITDQDITNATAEVINIIN